jgi:DUF4097 and DUF4098 domain-containing protein YvlB
LRTFEDKAYAIASNSGKKGGLLKRLSKCVAVLLLILPAATAQQTRVYGAGGDWIQEVTGSLAAVKNLRVKVDLGSVQINGGSQPGIDYSIRNQSFTGSEDKARREFENYKVTANVRGDTAWIVAEWEGGRAHKFSSDLKITAPRNLEEVKVETEGGNVSTIGVSGRVDAESGGGNIRLDDIGGPASGETGGGTIDVGSVASDVNLHTGGGAIRVNSAKGKIVAESGGGTVTVISGGQGAELETGGGSIHVDHCDGRVKVSTGGGNIDLGDIGGPAQISTGGGSIRLNSAKGPVSAETGGGSIELGGVPSAHAETGAGGIQVKLIPGNVDKSNSSLETSAGDITIYLAAGVNISVRASIEVANGHNIHSDFPEIRVASEGGDYGPKTVTAEGNLNGGGPTLKVETMTGDISFRRTSR